MYRPWRRQIATLLPLVGPFEGLAPTRAETLTDLTISTNTTLGDTEKGAPLTRNAITINAARTLSPNTSFTAALFIWANTVEINGTIHANGAAGQSTATSKAGVGGAGGSGGGGGGAVLGNAGAGGSGTDGGTAGAAGGNGTGTTYNSGFTYGNGGDGANGSGGGGGLGGSKGLGGNGYGGGGGGGAGDGGGTAGGGGGGGGGLVVLISNELLGSGSITAIAGTGGSGAASGGAGGGGVLYIAAKKYSGSLTSSVSGINTGTARIFEITSTLSLTERTFTDSWDNL